MILIKRLGSLLTFLLLAIGLSASPGAAMGSNATASSLRRQSSDLTMEPQATIDRAIRSAWQSYESLVKDGLVQGRVVALFPALCSDTNGDSLVGASGEDVAKRMRELAPKGVVCLSGDGLKKRLEANLLGTASYGSVDDLALLTLELQVGFAFGGRIDIVKDMDVVGGQNFDLRIVGVRPFESGADFDHISPRVHAKDDGVLGARIRAFCALARRSARIAWGAAPKATQPSKDPGAQARYLATVVSQAVADFVEANRDALNPDASGLPLGVAPSLWITADGEKNSAFSNLVEREFARPDLRLGALAEPREMVKRAAEAFTQLRFFVDEDPSPSVLRALRVRGVLFADYDYQEWLERLTIRLRFVGARESLAYSIDLSTQRTRESLAKALGQAGVVPRDAAEVDAELMLLGALKRTAGQLVLDYSERLADSQLRVAPVLTPATAVWENVLEWYRSALLGERERVLSAAAELWKGAKAPEAALADAAFPVKLASGQNYSCWSEAQMAVLLEASCAFTSTKEQSAATRWKDLVAQGLSTLAIGAKLCGAESDKSQLAGIMSGLGAGAKPVVWREVQPGHLIQLKVTPVGATFVEVTAKLIDWNKPFEVVASATERLPKSVYAGIAKLLETSSFPEDALLTRFLGRTFDKSELASFDRK